jgi:uncharacterized protein
VSAFLSKPCTAFEGDRLLSAGPLIEVALSVKNAIEGGEAGTVLTFDDATGAVVDLDLRGSKTEIIARLSEQAIEGPTRLGSGPASSAVDAVDTPSAPRGRGRPRLGVVAREVTLLPRHWEWLAGQPGGASVILRRLVDDARRVDGGQSHARARQAIAYRFMSAMAGDLPGFEEAARALFAGNHESFTRQMATWPADLRTYALKLALTG